MRLVPIVATFACAACGRFGFDPLPGALVDATDASSADAAMFNDVTDPQWWATFDLGPLTGATEFSGGVFDGRYVYLGPWFSTQSKVVRYDTQDPFTSASSWSVYDTGMQAWGGVVFDGQYVYVLPYMSPSALRYDPQLVFTDAASWQSVATSVANLDLVEGGMFDDGYVYTAAYTINRYDVSGAFTSGASWQQFDPSVLSPPGADLLCGASDGRYLYFMSDDQYGTPVRYDTTAPFMTNTSWESVDLLGFNPRFHQLSGAVFDGRYIYSPASASDIVLQYDTTASFSAQASWQAYDTPTNGDTTAFDGRYVYFGGNGGNTTFRYDTTAPYTSASSWSSFDAGTDFIDGIVFDGHYLYFLPQTGTVVARFEAISLGSPSPVLPGLHGTF